MRVHVSSAMFVALAGISVAFASAWTKTIRKDKVAVILYGDLLGPPTVIERPDTANMVEIALLRIRGAAVDPGQLAARPCLGIALFTAEEWQVAKARGPQSAEAMAALARTHAWLYPAVGADSAVVLDPGTQAQGSEVKRTVWIALGAFHLKGSSIPVRVSPDTPVRCNVRP